MGTWLDPARSTASVLSEVPSAFSGSSKKWSEIPVHFTQATNHLSNLNDFPSLLHVLCIWVSELEVKGSKNVITSPLRHLVLQGYLTGSTYLYFRNWGREKRINNTQIFFFCSKKCFHRYFWVGFFVFVWLVLILVLVFWFGLVLVLDFFCRQIVNARYFILEYIHNLWANSLIESYFFTT